MRANNGSDLAFAVPARLVTRKRTRDSEADGGKEASGPSTDQPAKGFFISREAYDRYSIDGDARLTQLADHYQQQQKQHIASTASLSAKPPTKEDDVDRPSDHNHLTRRLLQHKRTHSSVVELVDNCFRRISSLTIRQHETYVALLHKRIQSQQVQYSDPKCSHLSSRVDNLACSAVSRRCLRCRLQRSSSGVHCESSCTRSRCGKNAC